MTSQKIEYIIYEWVAEHYGENEADDPSWDIKNLAECIFEKLNRRED